ncbi:hypothetical protein TSUD_07800 [Trifolium subterraneum]|uniref:ABC transmembrane type-1 domain-containing protein n=1 Tax=Trifolium subterraneum TaxID=3900 RepID=A0A2Z6MHV7_TRISU|nr:hypothetical protein TSUD_07800 [Trifolium subterraneum]
MATDNSLEGDIPSLQPVVDIDRKQDSEKSKAKDEKTETVPLYKLFSFADPLDRLLMLVGTVGAIGNGLSIPLMLLIFGSLINSFGDSTDSNVVDEISKVIFSLVSCICIPFIVLSGALTSMAIAKATSTGQAAYSKSASVVEQTISSIRTVASFTGEKEAIAKYNQSLIKVCKTSVQEALASGSHDELTKDPNGAYSQLIRLQETKGSEQNDVNDTNKSNSILYSGRQSSQRSFSSRSISQGSSGNSGHHSFSASHVAPTADGFLETADGEPQASLSIVSSPPELPLYRLTYFNKPEILVLLMGTIAAVLQGVLMPTFGVMLSKMISVFYKPAHELRHDSKVWAIVFEAVAVASLLIIP